MFKVELNTFGFNKIVTPNVDPEGVKVGNKLTIYGHGWIDKVAMAILNFLGKVFSSLRTVPIQMTNEPNPEMEKLFSLSDIHTTRSSLERYLCKQVKVYAEAQNYAISETKIIKKIRKVVSNSRIIPLKETIINLSFALDISTHGKIRKMIDGLTRATPDLSTPHWIKFPFAVNRETGEVVFKESKDKRWVNGSLDINDSKDVQIKFSSEDEDVNCFYLGKLMRGLQKHLLFSDRLGDAIDNFKKKLIVDEFSSYVGPFMVPMDEEMGVEVAMPEKPCKVKANKINLGKYTYIASPEPPKDAGNLFWTMIAQQESPLIVKLKATTNDAQIYWPEAGNDLVYESCTVKLAKEEALSPHLMKRTFHIEKESGAQIVHQLDFSDWADGETPDISSFMELMHHVNELDIPPEKPITVHCRAGIGRTGTFMAIHNAIKEPGAKIANLVHAMRIQRPGRPMVENEKQYAYIHQVCDFYKKAENNKKCT